MRLGGGSRARSRKGEALLPFPTWQARLWFGAGSGLWESELCWEAVAISALLWDENLGMETPSREPPLHVPEACPSGFYHLISYLQFPPCSSKALGSSLPCISACLLVNHHPGHVATSSLSS